MTSFSPDPLSPDQLRLAEVMEYAATLSRAHRGPPRFPAQDPSAGREYRASRPTGCS